MPAICRWAVSIVRAPERARAPAQSPSSGEAAYRRSTGERFSPSIIPCQKPRGRIKTAAQPSCGSPGARIFSSAACPSGFCSRERSSGENVPCSSSRTPIWMGAGCVSSHAKGARTPLQQSMAAKRRRNGAALLLSPASRPVRIRRIVPPPFHRDRLQNQPSIRL